MMITSILQPQIRLLTTSALNSGVLGRTLATKVLTASALQNHAYSTWWSKRRFESMPSVAYQRQQYSDKSDSKGSAEAGKEAENANGSTRDALDTIQRRMWDHMNDLRRHRTKVLEGMIKENPYEAFFGWSNRLLSGSRELHSLAEKHLKKFEQETIKAFAPHQMTQRYTTEQSKSEELEYDPITNRMVRKDENPISHYGQDLDTAVDIPVKSPKQKVSNQLDQRPSQNSSPPPVADVLAELGQVSRLPPLKPKFVELPNTNIDRQRLNEVYDQLHASSIKPVIGESTPESSQLEASQKATMEDLAERLKNIGSRIQNLAKSQAEPNPVKPTVDSTDTNVSTQETSSKSNRSLDNEIASDEIASTSEPSYVAKVKSANAGRQQQINKLKSQLADLNLAREHLKAGSLKFDLTKQSAEISRLIEDLQSSMEPIYPHRRWDSGRERLQPQQIPKEDVFDMLFGDKTSSLPRSLKMTEPSQTQLSSEVQIQKEAMQKAEESRLNSVKEEKLNDKQLVNTIRSIYEDKYGKIEVPEALRPKVEAVEPSKEFRTTSATSTIITSPPASAKAGPLNSSDIEAATKKNHASSTLTETESSQAEYTVLSYDPSTSEVSTTSLSAPMSNGDKSIPLTVALTQLEQPGKFLSHLRLLGNKGSIVSVSENLLVLRTTPPVSGSQTSASTQAPFSKMSETQRLPQKDPYSAEFEGATPRRIEPVFSGRRHNRWNEERWAKYRARRWRFRRIMRRIFVFIGMSSVMLYLGGLFAGLRRVEIPKERSLIKDRDSKRE